jgi:hypothetical protein
VRCRSLLQRKTVYQNKPNASRSVCFDKSTYSNMPAYGKIQADRTLGRARVSPDSSTKTFLILERIHAREVNPTWGATPAISLRREGLCYE